RAEDIVEPYLGLRGVLVVPRIPRINRLGLSRNKAPVDRPDLSARENRQDALERAAARPRHVLGADYRSTVALQRTDESVHGGAVVVAVEREDVGAVEHESRRRPHPRGIDVVAE